MAWKRIPKSVDAKAHKARRYYNTKNPSETISDRQAEKIRYKGKSKEARIKERAKKMSSLSSRKAKVTRAINKTLREYGGDKITRADRDFLAKLRAIKKKRGNIWDHLGGELTGQVNHANVPLYNGEKGRFQDLFDKYPANAVRNWLDSDEKSRGLRSEFGGFRQAA